MYGLVPELPLLPTSEAGGARDRGVMMAWLLLPPFLG